MLITTINVSNDIVATNDVVNSAKYNNCRKGYANYKHYYEVVVSTAITTKVMSLKSSLREVMLFNKTVMKDQIRYKDYHRGRFKLR